jgi:large subunit ribosomal protein L4
VNDSLFTKKPATFLLAQAIRVYRSNLRQGTSYTKTRSEVKRTKTKWYKQKGTGNARHGARTPNIFVGGGVSHGPRAIENWSKKLNAKSKLVALQTSLTLQKGNLFLSKNLASIKGKTKEAVALLNNVADENDKVLVVLAKSNPIIVRAFRNLEKVLVVTADRLNALHVSNADKIVFEYASLKVLEDRMAKIKKSKIKK